MANRDNPVAPTNRAYWLPLLRHGVEPWEVLAGHRPGPSAAFAADAGTTPLEAAEIAYSAATRVASACGSTVGKDYYMLGIADRILAGDADGVDEAIRHVLANSTIGGGARPNAHAISLPEMRDDAELRRLETEAAAAREAVIPGNAASAMRYARSLGDARLRRRDLIAKSGLQDHVFAPREAAVRSAAWSSSARRSRVGLALELDAGSLAALRSLAPKYGAASGRITLLDPEHSTADAPPEWAVGADLVAEPFGFLAGPLAEALVVTVSGRASEPSRTSRRLHAVLWLAPGARLDAAASLMDARRPDPLPWPVPPLRGRVTGASGPEAP